MWWNRLLLLSVIEISKTCNLKTIHIKDMINLWSLAQMVLELLTCPFVHGQLWRNIVKKKIRKKTKRVREWSIFPRFQAFDYGANVRSFPSCWEPRNGSSWISFSVFSPFVCYSFDRSEKLVKCEREICVKFTPICCMTITKKYLFVYQFCKTRRRF